VKTFFSFFGNPVYKDRKSMGRIMTFLSFLLLCTAHLIMIITDRVFSDTLMKSLEGTFQSLLIYEGYKKARTVVENKIGTAKPADPVKQTEEV
jgi:hypothetical protein